MEGISTEPRIPKHCYANTPPQRSLLWRTLRAMPLRLLEKVMPWIVGEWNRGEGK